jgi:archaemetzincin
MSKTIVVSLVAFFFALTVWRVTASPPAPNSAKVAKLKTMIEQLKPLHKPLGKPQPGEWLAEHKETGQTFAEYLQARPVTPQGARNVIYVQPLGEFLPSQRKIVTLTAEFMSRYFNRPVKLLDDLPMSVVPDEARRRHPITDGFQIRSTYVLDSVLKPRLPKDAAALIAFTATDLWPGDGWNFVFGQASLSDRVGVWSINRNGNPDAGDEEYRLCLLRTIKTAVHETGHMFSIKHCTKYECNMCGSNSRAESDRQPLEACPECVAKICWATDADPAERFRKLAEFCKEQGLETQRQFYEKSLAAVSAGQNTASDRRK